MAVRQKFVFLLTITHEYQSRVDYPLKFLVTELDKIRISLHGHRTTPCVF